MLIIIEGPDCVGKSTLAVRLIKYLERFQAENEVKLLHKGPPTAHPLDEYELPLVSYRPGTGEHIIADRWHVGEGVYPCVFGRTTRYDAAVRLHVELFLRSRGALLVHVTGPDERLVNCIERRGDDLVTSEQAHTISDLFTRQVDASVMHHVTVDGFKVMESDDALAALVRRARIIERAHAHLNRFITYVGNRRPRLLLLGDLRGKTKPPTSDLRPAFMPYPTTSGHYLLTQLAQYVPPEALRRIGIVNACDVDDAHDLWLRLGKPYTIALGRNAFHAALTWANGSVSHPQHRRRFHYRGGEEYARQLGRVLLETPGLTELDEHESEALTWS